MGNLRCGLRAIACPGAGRYIILTMTEPRDLPRTGRVYLVGAGPGDPGLLTLRAVECLRAADLVIYDGLVNRRLLEHAEQAEHVCVTELAGTHAARPPHVHRLMLDAAAAGKTVVRLKGGDPFVFGRGGEEAAVLREAGVPYEIVPGVTAGLAAGASTGIPLTHRGLSSAVAFVTGHEDPHKGEPALDWAALARFPGTLVVYMGLDRLAAVTQALLLHGKSADTPAVSVRWAATGRQVTVEGTLATLAERVRQAGLQPPVVTLIGPVVGLRPALAWFERRPLFGKRVLVTRPRRQAAALVRPLENLGATVYLLPTVEIGPAPDPAAVERAIARLDDYDWLVFTSANGVEALVRRVLETGRDLRAFGRIRLAAIGPRTAEALAGFHLRADLTPPEYRSESLAAALAPHVAGQRVLLARADRGREVLREQLAAVARVEQVAVYAQSERVAADPEVMGLLERGEMDFVTLTSANIARAFISALGPAARAQLGRSVRLVTISPVTSAAVRELGYEVAAEAAEFTAAGVVRALLALTSCP